MTKEIFRIIGTAFYLIVLLAFNKAVAQKAIAFPGAEGFGKYASGGRGGLLIKVTNLNNSGPGSFRAAAEMNKPRIIVFEVSGVIRLESRVLIRSNVTILGQTAPGDGICIADKSVQLNGDNIIIRYLRFRLGDRYQRLDGMVDGSGGEDAFSGTKRKNIVIDHCSFSWSNDEALSVYAGDSTTIQWCIISEPLNYSYHFEKGDKDWEHHGYGGIWGGRHLSAHHNLFAHCKNRNPRFDGIRNSESELVDFRNNVIYNWGENSIYAGEGGNYNLVNNYYKSGQDTKKSVRSNIVSPGKREPDIPFGKFYVNGNVTEGFPAVSTNNWLGVNMGNNGTEEDKRNTLVQQPHAVEEMNTETAEIAFEKVLLQSGASFKRDSLDQRISEDVKMGKGRIIDVQGGFEHGIEFEKTLGAWPFLKMLSPSLDSDSDGMPDAWEASKNLIVGINDAQKNSLHPAYTNIEYYANELLEKSNKK